jgi:hypothetical protein
VRGVNRGKRERDFNAMEHCNGSQFVAVSIVTTGPNPFIHEIIQLSLLALDAKLKPRKDVIPLCLNLTPWNPERLESGKISKEYFVNIMKSSFDKDDAAEMVMRWKEKLGMGFTEFGNPKFMIPLAYDYTEIKPFLIRWIDPVGYAELFDDRHRDVRSTALYLNEQASFHARRVPYSKVLLSWLCKQHKIEAPKRQDSLGSTVCVAELYRQMSLLGLL